MVVSGNLLGISGSTKIKGNIISSNKTSAINLSGSAHLSYVPPVSAITQEFFPVAATRPADVRYYLE